MTAAETKARKMIAARTTAQLLTDWDLTEAALLDQNRDIREVAIVRGWLMDELEKRDPEAFEAWMDDEDIDATPRTYFAA